MLLSRASCRFGTITPALLRMLTVVETLSTERDLTVVVLSATDGAHSLYSRHDQGEAIDLKVHGLSDEARAEFLDTLLTRLGRQFMGLVERPGETTEHLHLQVKWGLTYNASDRPLAPALKMTPRAPASA